MNSPFIRKLYLIWRLGKKQRRIVIGEISSHKGEYTFKYDITGVKHASNFGFVNYPDFPDINKVYHKNVIEIFSQRLNDLNRSDTDKYFDFWEIDKRFADDKYYLLAQTQGILSTDNFEFLAWYYLKKDLIFISEIAGISYSNISSESLQIGDNLGWAREPNNSHDPNAILVKKGDTNLGYIKRIHNYVFKEKRSENLKIKVKDIERKDGNITRVFISIKNLTK